MPCRIGIARWSFVRLQPTAFAALMLTVQRCISGNHGRIAHQRDMGIFRPPSCGAVDGRSGLRNARVQGPESLPRIMQARTGAPSGSSSCRSTMTEAPSAGRPGKSSADAEASEASRIAAAAVAALGSVTRKTSGHGPVSCGSPEVSKAASELQSDQPTSLRARTTMRYVVIASSSSSTQRQAHSRGGAWRWVSAQAAVCHDVKAWSERYCTSKRRTGAPSGSGTFHSR
mmetsp:Transcript_2747/g.10813  ORF Transcript_2747/g.10813 Transcript_2747/m.10813 type:complete len:229 (-) Transcript_2747:2123-2809(-)